MWLVWWRTTIRPATFCGRVCRWLGSVESSHCQERAGDWSGDWSPVNGWIVLSPAPGDLVTGTQVSIYKGYNRCQWGHCQNSSVSDGYKIQDNLKLTQFIRSKIPLESLLKYLKDIVKGHRTVFLKTWFLIVLKL